jgi:hypothetical protein
MQDTRRDPNGAKQIIVASALSPVRGGGDSALIVARTCSAPLPPVLLRRPPSLRALIGPASPSPPASPFPSRAGVVASAEPVRQMSSEATTSPNAHGTNVVSQAVVHVVPKKSARVGTPACPNRIVPAHSPAAWVKVGAAA